MGTKTITVYLMDGRANGRIKVTIPNYNILFYKIPREQLELCKTIDAFARSGVYFLLGKDSVYVGQAEVRNNGEGIYKRIKDHKSDRLKKYWDDVVIFTTTTARFGRTDISFLENNYFNKAKLAKHYKVLNNNNPTAGTVTEEKQAELEEYIAQSELILGTLGYKVFDKLPLSNSENKNIGYSKNKKVSIPPLPTDNMKIGAFVHLAMKNLSESGYEFSKQSINEMCKPEWSKKHFRTVRPFFKLHEKNKNNNTLGVDGRRRFWKDEFVFGNITVYISKEWYARQYECFKKWYLSLNE